MNSKANPGLKNGFILIVDDSSSQRQLLQYFLEHNYYKVITAQDGAEALKIMEEITPSLIISDIVMPNMNGYDLCREIKQRKNTSAVPVILLTVLSSSEDMIKGLECGADSFISKPYSEDYLITLVEKTIERKIVNYIHHEEIRLPVSIDGNSSYISVDPARIISLMLSAYESALIKNKELAQTQSELKVLNDNLGELVIARTAELSKLNSEKDKFFSIIAHDLKSPFQGLIGLTGLMADDISGFSIEEISSYSKSMHSTASNLLRLLKNLLDWAQMQKGAISFSPQKIDLSLLIYQNIDLISPRAKQKGIHIINEVLGNQFIFADEKMINTVLRNLLSNAIKFTHRNGSVYIKSRFTENETIEISLTDTGVGISNENIKKLFRIEERVRSKGTEDEESTGLGLLLCKEFVLKNGGNIWVESKENRGSTFYLTLKQFCKESSLVV